ncbi:hypothetical protein Tco_1398489 [Tanacetum coccineum]
MEGPKKRPLVALLAPMEGPKPLLAPMEGPKPLLAPMEGNGYSRKGRKTKQKHTRDGKDKFKSKPKSVKVRKSTPTKSKVNQMKKIQLEGLKLPNLKLYYKNNKTRAEFGN